MASTVLIRVVNSSYFSSNTLGIVLGGVKKSVSCNDEMTSSGYFSENSNSGSEPNIVLQERNPNLPIATTAKFDCEEPGLRSNSSGEKGNTDALLGRAYRLINGNFILGDYENVKGKVVDIEAVRAYDDSYITGKQLMTTETSSFTYSNFERYLYKSTVTNAVKSGFSLNFELFSIGKSKSTTKIFRPTIDNTSEKAYGELNIDFLKSSFSLQESEASRRLYARQFLTKSFMRSLYNSPIASTLDSYGDFVLTGYHTGGKAYASYLGQADGKFNNSERKEKEIGKSITASLKWRNDSANGNIGFYGSDSISMSEIFANDKIFVYIKTIGGIRDGSESGLKVVPLKELNVDLTSWMQSLNDVESNTMVAVSDNGLFPISDFVLEKNFKRRFDDTFYGVLERKEQLVAKPYVEIVRVFVRSTDSYESLYDVAAVLVTRQGDRIILSDGKAVSATDEQLRENANEDVFLQKVQKIKDEKSMFFSKDIEISYNKETKLNPILRSPLCIDFTGFNEKNFYRFYYEKTNIEYIYDPTTRLCFSYFCDEGDDEILDIYGIRGWVDSLPRKNISIASLANSYNIIGL